MAERDYLESEVTRKTSPSAYCKLQIPSHFLFPFLLLLKSRKVSRAGHSLPET